jgi:hypothetical protein
LRIFTTQQMKFYYEANENLLCNNWCAKKSL